MNACLVLAQRSHYVRTQAMVAMQKQVAEEKRKAIVHEDQNKLLKAQLEKARMILTKNGIACDLAAPPPSTTEAYNIVRTDNVVLSEKLEKAQRECNVLTQQCSVLGKQLRDQRMQRAQDLIAFQSHRQEQDVVIAHLRKQLEAKIAPTVSALPLLRCSSA